MNPRAKLTARRSGSRTCRPCSPSYIPRAAWPIVAAKLEQVELLLRDKATA